MKLERKGSSMGSVIMSHSREGGVAGTEKLGTEGELEPEPKISHSGSKSVFFSDASIPVWALPPPNPRGLEGVWPCSSERNI